MPRITRTVGTGMTQRGVVEFDPDDPEDVAAQIGAAVESLDRTSFSRTSRRLAPTAIGILDAAQLPSDPHKLYAVTEDGLWGVLDDVVLLKAVADGRALPLTAAVLACGYPEDSAEGYAASMLVHLSAAERQAQAGNVDEAMALAFAAGELANEAGMKATYEEDFLVGEKVRAGGRAASISSHGTEEARAARRDMLGRAFDLLVAKGTGRMAAYRAVAKHYKVSVRTIRRAVAARQNKD